MSSERQYELHDSTYEWSARLFDSVRHALKVNIKMHYDRHQVQRGEIFLFNHFARFETFIPQYLLFRESGAMCRSVAAAQFFKGDERLAGLLTRLGVLPNDHPRLLPLLAAEILRGRKVVIFPEGGMVKDRRVVDEQGDYSVYSRKARTRRKHHTGAAVLAVGLEAFRVQVRAAEGRGDWKAVDRWAELLGFERVDALLDAVQRPTMIVPANITFYPLRVSDNAIAKGVERFSGTLSPRALEELIIESNILTRDTDMDIRLGEPLMPGRRWRLWERAVVENLGANADEFDRYFDPDTFGTAWTGRLQQRGLKLSVEKLRDDYMHRMYTAITTNLSHVASHLLLELRKRGTTRVEVRVLNRMIYLAVKALQTCDGVHLHRSLHNPASYMDLIDARCAGVEQLIDSCVEAGVLARDGTALQLLDKLSAEPDFDQIRLENPIVVYANEAEPVEALERVIAQSIEREPTLDARALARLSFDDELRSWRWDREFYRAERFAEINAAETATESGEPFMHLPAQPRKLGIVLAHGLLGSPAEFRSFGARLAALGYPCIAARLKGHGTSPWDLSERSWSDWLGSVERAYAILSAYVEQICLVGFSTGGVLSLLMASQPPSTLAGVVSIAAPLKFRNRNMVFVPLLHGANQFIRSFTPTDGVKPFRVNESERPHINYRHVPIRALYELKQLVETLDEVLPKVRCPVQIVQGTEDKVVDPASAKLLHEGLGSASKQLTMIPSQRHGVLTEDIGDTQRVVEKFIAELERGV